MGKLKKFNGILFEERSTHTFKGQAEADATHVRDNLHRMARITERKVRGRRKRYVVWEGPRRRKR